MHLGTGVRIPPPPIFDTIRCQKLSRASAFGHEPRGNLEFFVKNACMWCVYILKCTDVSFYVGRTDNLPQRIERHNKGRASAWTKNRLPIKLVYKENYENKKDAAARERQIKKWSHAKKQLLINEDF